jgi:hypothetical protein
MEKCREGESILIEVDKLTILVPSGFVGCSCEYLVLSERGSCACRNPCFWRKGSCCGRVGEYEFCPELLSCSSASETESRVYYQLHQLHAKCESEVQYNHHRLVSEGKELRP